VDPPVRLLPEPHAARENSMTITGTRISTHMDGIQFGCFAEMTGWDRSWLIFKVSVASIINPRY